MKLKRLIVTSLAFVTRFVQGVSHHELVTMTASCMNQIMKLNTAHSVINEIKVEFKSLHWEDVYDAVQSSKTCIECNKNVANAFVKITDEALTAFCAAPCCPYMAALCAIVERDAHLRSMLLGLGASESHIFENSYITCAGAGLCVDGWKMPVMKATQQEKMIEEETSEDVRKCMPCVTHGVKIGMVMAVTEAWHYCQTEKNLQVQAFCEAMMERPDFALGFLAGETEPWKRAMGYCVGVKSCHPFIEQPARKHHQKSNNDHDQYKDLHNEFQQQHKEHDKEHTHNKDHYHNFKNHHDHQAEESIDEGQYHDFMHRHQPKESQQRDGERDGDFKHHHRDHHQHHQWDGDLKRDHEHHHHESIDHDEGHLHRHHHQPKESEHRDGERDGDFKHHHRDHHQHHQCDGDLKRDHEHHHHHEGDKSMKIKETNIDLQQKHEIDQHHDVGAEDIKDVKEKDLRDAKSSCGWRNWFQKNEIAILS